MAPLASIGQRLGKQKNKKGPWELALLGFTSPVWLRQGSQPPRLPGGVMDRTPPRVLAESEWWKEVNGLKSGYSSLG